MGNLIFVLRNKTGLVQAKTFKEIQSLMKQGYLGYTQEDFENFSTFFDKEPRFNKIKKGIAKIRKITPKELIREVELGRMNLDGLDKDYSYTPAIGEKGLVLDPIISKNFVTMTFGFVLPENAGITVKQNKNNGKNEVSLVIRGNKSMREISRFLASNSKYIRALLEEMPTLNLNLHRDADVLLASENTGKTRKDIMDDPKYIAKNNEQNLSEEKISVDKHRIHKKLESAMDVK
ncbi:MAG: hypothetical protein FWF35_04180 [Elusimicrobia bacterium]|nr:hypothetical protein [Elusimicrobiota bacterium]